MLNLRYKCILLLLLSSSAIAATNKMAISQKTFQPKLLEAVEQRKSEQHFKAISVLDQLVNDGLPQQKRVHFELLLNYFKTNQFGKAQQQINLLKQMHLTTKERKKVVKMQQLLDKTATRFKNAQHQFQFAASLTYGKDSYTSTQYQSDSYIVEYFDEQIGAYVYDEYAFTRPSSDKITRQRRYSGQQLNLNYGYYPSFRFEFFDKATKIQWLNSADFYHRNTLNNNASAYNKGEILSTVKIVHPDFTLGLSINEIDHWYSGRRFQRSFSSKYYLQFYVEKAQFQFGYQWLMRKYFDDPQDQFSQEFLQNSVQQIPFARFSYPITDNLYWQIGGKFKRQRAKNADYDNRTHYFYSNLHYQFNQVFSGALSFNYNKLHYDNDDPKFYWWVEEQGRYANLSLKYHVIPALSVSLSSVYYFKNTDNELIDSRWRRNEVSLTYQF